MTHAMSSLILSSMSRRCLGRLRSSLGPDRKTLQRISTLAMSEADLARVQAHIDEALKHSRHLQELVARPSQAHAIPAERSVPPTASVPATEPPLALSRAEAAEGHAGVMLSPEGQLADLQGHFNALLQVLSRRCLNHRD
jgi:hypothetical protein